MTGAPRLLLLNGLPGVGKSLLARHHVRGSPGTLCLDPALLHGWIGGDPDDHDDHGDHGDLAHAESVRTLWLAMATAHLAGGHDVVVPQLVSEAELVLRVAEAARAGGGRLVHVVLAGTAVEARVPDEALARLVADAEGLAVVCRMPGVHLLHVPGDDVTEVHPRLLQLLDAG
ncbi:AAA family ATPase [Nocardioides nanhaiensis]|uniref:ATP-binding protein n=1 Tax=Nocardioides nanhaiensis TaxID=1476871 RepID=A0ABP8X686_9ACTN